LNRSVKKHFCLLDCYYYEVLGRRRGRRIDVGYFELCYLQSHRSGLQQSHHNEAIKVCLGDRKAGMVTSIVQSVQSVLQQTGSQTINAEVIFPVSSEAVMSTDGDDTNTSGMACLVPGLSGGEGCSTVGGYVTCPFMKMNDLYALQDTIDMVASNDSIA
jgi:hypothetical protein